LAHQWIPLADIDPNADPAAIANTHALDTRSLGGHLDRGDLMGLSISLRERSPSFKRAVELLSQAPRDRLSRLYAFVRDLDATLEPITAALRDNAYLVLTLGNRSIGGHRIPLDEILVELFAHHRVVRVTAVDRRIPTKRMATRNQLAATMRSECTLVLRKAVAAT
jgi:hypothetical protein